MQKGDVLRAVGLLDIFLDRFKSREAGSKLGDVPSRFIMKRDIVDSAQVRRGRAAGVND
jgi:hypothetical protein